MQLLIITISIVNELLQ